MRPEGTMSDADLPAREAMEFDVVVVGAGPAGLAAAIRLKQLNPELGVVVVEKGSEVGAHILSGAVIDPIGLDQLLPDWRSEDAPIKTAGHRRPLLLARAVGRAARTEFPAAAADVEPRQLHRVARQCVPLARHQGRGARRRDLSGLRGGRSALRRARRSRRRRDRRHGHRQEGRAQGRVHARHGAARQIHAVRRGRARLALEAADRAIRAGEGSRAAEIRHRPEGAVEGRAREAQAGTGAAHASAGRSTIRPAAARSSTTSRTNRSSSASWCT